MKEKYIALAKKLNALAKQGIDCEKYNAEKKLNALMQKHGIALSDIEVSAANCRSTFIGVSTVKPDCSRHKKEVAGITDMKVLAEMIGDLHYETLTQLLNELCLKVNEDGTKDYNAGRKLLGGFLIECGDKLSEAADCALAAWQTSKPFMK